MVNNNNIELLGGSDAKGQFCRELLEFDFGNITLNNTFSILMRHFRESFFLTSLRSEAF